MNKNIEKWSSIMEALGVTDKVKIVKMSEYADNFAKMETSKYTSGLNTSGVLGNLLPINLRIMKDLDNFEITTDTSKIEVFSYSIIIDSNFDINSIDSLSKLESVLIHTIIEDLKDKDILIYSLVDSVFIMKYDGINKLVMSSRIKKSN
jgi:hypothetical protein